jgi:hypothetical protein
LQAAKRSWPDLPEALDQHDGAAVPFVGSEPGLSSNGREDTR